MISFILAFSPDGNVIVRGPDQPLIVVWFSWLGGEGLLVEREREREISTKECGIEWNNGLTNSKHSTARAEWAAGGVRLR